MYPAHSADDGTLLSTAYRPSENEDVDKQFTVGDSHFLFSPSRMFDNGNLHGYVTGDSTNRTNEA